MKVMLVGGVATMHRKTAKCIAPFGLEVVATCEAGRSGFPGIPGGVEAVLILYEMASHPMTEAARAEAEERGILAVHISRKWAVAFGQLQDAKLISGSANAPAEGDEEEDAVADPIQLKTVAGNPPLPTDVLEAAKALVEAMKTDTVQVTKIWFERRAGDGQYQVSYEVIVPQTGGVVL